MVVPNKSKNAKKYNSKPKNKLRRNELQRLRHKKNKEIVDTIKSQPCMDCGISYPSYVMDFDHVRGTKIANISSMRFERPIGSILEEISKCDIVCSNCHRIRTFRRSQ